jgi:TatD DNase family protein
MEAIGDPSGYDEIVFCGYGEPMLRLNLIKEVALQLKKEGCRIRINTDGLATIRTQRAGLGRSTACPSASMPDADIYLKRPLRPGGL